MSNFLQINSQDDEEDMDEPLDMSIKRREPANENLPQKKRFALEEYEKGFRRIPIDNRTDHSKSSTLNSTEIIGNNDEDEGHDYRIRKSPSPNLKKHDAGSIKENGSKKDSANYFVINHFPDGGDGGLEEHFRRSLMSNKQREETEVEGVDEHFSRSLGSDKWKELQQNSAGKLGGKSNREKTGSKKL